jgi:hypothetical protein
MQPSAFEKLPQGLCGQIGMLFRIKKAKTEAYGSLWKGPDGPMGRRGTVKTGTAHDAPLLLKIEGCIGWRYIPEVE